MKGKKERGEKKGRREKTMKGMREKGKGRREKKGDVNN